MVKILAWFLVGLLAGTGATYWTWRILRWIGGRLLGDYRGAVLTPEGDLLPRAQRREEEP